MWCYKILFGIVDVQSNKFLEFNMRPSRGHQYKLYKNRSVSRVRAAFFSERVVNVWNSLPDSVDFSTLSKFRRSIMGVDFSKFLKCFLLSQYIRCNDKATVSACMSLVYLAHRLYDCTVSSVFVLTLFEQIK